MGWLKKTEVKNGKTVSYEMIDGQWVETKEVHLYEETYRGTDPTSGQTIIVRKRVK